MARYWNLQWIYTFAEMPPEHNGELNVCGGHAQGGLNRENALKRFAAGDTSVIVYSVNEYTGTGTRITDPTEISWPHQYRPPVPEEQKS